MSVITDMVIFTTFDEADAMGRLNEWHADGDDTRCWFTRLDTDAAGGPKVFTSGVWAMAGNYFPHRELIEAFPTFGWRSPAEVVLVVGYELADETYVVRGDGKALGAQ